MLLNPKTPLIVGTALIVVVVGLLATYAPMPGQLSSAHSQIRDLAGAGGCRTCHSDEGLTKGCLDCHHEIATQLSEGVGYHHSVHESGEADCARCHSEHFGAEFKLVNEVSWGAQVPEAYRHPHVEFNLAGKHDLLKCNDCHEDRVRERFTLKRFPFMARQKTFLNLNQECVSCHKDNHSNGLTGSCDSCHGQEFFDPPVHFDHREFFPLEGGHDGLQCSACHFIPRERPEAGSQVIWTESQTKDVPQNFPFHEVRGKECKECHTTPHRARFWQPCNNCHPASDPLWTSAKGAMTPEWHVSTGFRLAGPHAEVNCDKCHNPDQAFEERHPDPSDPGYKRREETCEGCHSDPHAGQFDSKYGGCLSCHEKHRFRPVAFGRKEHFAEYELTGAHQAVSCTACHLKDQTGVRAFVGTSHECRSCHENPHGEQFSEEIAKNDCKACHSTDSFTLDAFDHNRFTRYPLKGAHARATCNECHVETKLVNGVVARRYKDTPTECSGCHKDVHRGQFEDYGTQCTLCHANTHSWEEVRFDHDQSEFPLRGAHAKASCSRCHLPMTLPDGTKFVRYKPLKSECRNCHEISRLRTRTNH